ncbi:MAG: helix-turn-helix domain-containing protein [Clostridium sp.]
MVYTYVINIIEANTLESNKNILNQAIQTLDEGLMNLDNSVKKLSIEPDFRLLWMKEMKDVGKLNYDFYNISKELDQYDLDGGLSSYYYIYFKKLGAIITPDNVYLDEQMFYNTDFRYERVEWSKWKSHLEENYFYQKTLPSTNVTIRGTDYKGVTYIQSVPVNAITTIPEGQICLFIDEQRIRELLEGVLGGKQGSFILSDYDKEVIFTSDDRAYEMLAIEETIREQAIIEGVVDTTIQGEEVFLFANELENMEWRVYFAIPKTAVFQEVRSLRIIIYIIFALTIALGGIGSLVWGYRKSKPLMKIINKLEQSVGLKEKTGNHYAAIEGAVDHLVDNKKRLKNQLEQQKVLIESSFIQSLVLGCFLSEEEVEKYRDNLNVQFPHSAYSVLIMKLNIDEEMDNLLYKLSKYKNHIGTYLDKINQYTYYICSMQQDKIVVLLNHNEMNEEVNTHVDCMTKELGSKIGCNLSLAIGSRYETLLDIYQSYNEAEYILENYNKPGRHIVKYSQQQHQENMFYYPLELENRLINLVVSGNKSEVRKTLQQIYEENFKIRNLSHMMQKQLIEEIYGTIIKVQNKSQILKDISIDKLYKSKEKGIEEFEEEINALIEVYCEYINEEKTNQYSELIDNVMKYIQQNYRKCELSLETVAHEFGFSPNYFSNLFKKYVGDTFVGYLTKMRMEEACKLLIEKNLNINEISIAVGYNNDQSFRRAFKRIVGCGPSEYKRMYKE